MTTPKPTSAPTAPTTPTPAVPPAFPPAPPDPTHEGRPSILVLGGRVSLQGRVAVATFDAPGALSVYAAAPPGAPCHGLRYRRPGEAVRGDDALREVVHQVVFHTAVAEDARAALASWVAVGRSAHFFIAPDGVVHQALDVAECAFHAGAASTCSVAVALVARPGADAFADAQYAAAAELVRALRARLESFRAVVPRGPDGEVAARALGDPAFFHGLLAAEHVHPGLHARGPDLDLSRIRWLANPPGVAFPLELAPGQNIAAAATPEAVRPLADALVHNNETETEGWFPLSAVQAWHGGLHLAAPEGTPVRALVGGVVVAYRADPRPTAFGSRSFVVLRHDVTVPSPQRAISPGTFVFFSLAMHVQLDERAAPPWLAALQRRGTAPPAFAGSGVVLVPWQERPIYVAEGEVLATVGRFGLGGGRAEVHVEVFAEPGWEAAFGARVAGAGPGVGPGGARARGVPVELRVIAGDVDDDLRCEDRDVLSAVGLSPDRLDDLRDPTRDEAALRAFWRDPDADGARRWLRSIVTRHVSEWSDAVDWLRALGAAEGWDRDAPAFRATIGRSALGAEAVAAVLPLLWLTAPVADHLGLARDRRGVLDHFHPLYFAEWLAFRALEERMGW